MDHGEIEVTMSDFEPASNSTKDVAGVDAVAQGSSSPSHAASSTRQTQAKDTGSVPPESENNTLSMSTSRNSLSTEEATTTNKPSVSDDQIASLPTPPPSSPPAEAMTARSHLKRRRMTNPNPIVRHTRPVYRIASVTANENHFTVHREPVNTLLQYRESLDNLYEGQDITKTTGFTTLKLRKRQGVEKSLEDGAGIGESKEGGGKDSNKE